MTTGRTNHTAFAAAAEPDPTPITALPVNGEKTEWVFLALWYDTKPNVFTTIAGYAGLQCEVFANKPDAEKYAAKREGYVQARAVMKGPLP